jgi:hypothetical protein
VSDRRLAVTAAIACAAAAIAATYLALPDFRAILTRHHWILYLYVGLFAGVTAAALAIAIRKITRRQ